MWNDYKRLYGMTEDEYELLRELNEEEDDYNDDDYMRQPVNWYDTLIHPSYEYDNGDHETEEEKILLGFFGDFGRF